MINNFLKLAFLILCFSVNSYSQSINDVVKIEVNNPAVKRTQSCDLALSITKIILDENYTRIDFVYKPENPYGVNIPRQPHLYLQIKADDGNIYKALQTGGMKNYGNNVKPDKPEWFSVIFEKMPLDILAFDLVEGKAIEGVYKLPKWNFYDVRIKTRAQIQADINRLKKDAEKGNADAAYELAIKYRKGKEVVKDETTALQYLQMSAEKGNVNAQFFVAAAMLNGTLPAEPNKVFTYLHHAAMGGLAHAQYNVAKCYEMGYGTDKNETIALEWLSRSAENGNSDAQYEFGCIADNSKRYEEAFGWYQKSALQGHVQAQLRLGLLYYWGLGVVEDNQKAFEWFSRSAEAGFNWAKYWLGNMYQEGYGIAKDRDMAIEWYREALDSSATEELKGNVYNRLGDIYYQERYAGGISYDVNQAVKYYNQAADLDNKHACFSLGKMYKTGEGVLKNPARAKELFLKSAELGNEKAQYELGMMFKGKNDLTATFKWMKQSAENNYAPAQYELGLMYYYGKGVAKNSKIAADWLEKSYNAGNEDAKKVWNGLQLWKYKQ